MNEGNVFELWQKVKDNRDYTSGTEYMIWHVDSGSPVDWYEDEGEAHSTYYSLISNEYATQTTFEGEEF